MLLTFCSARSPLASPDATTVSPATVDAVICGSAKASCVLSVGDRRIDGEVHRLIDRLLAPSPKSSLRLIPVVPRCVESLVTPSE